MNIFSFFKKRKSPNYNTKTLNYTQEKLPDELPTLIDVIKDKMKRSEPTTMTEISMLISDVFDIKAIESNLHRISPHIAKESVFAIDTVTLVTNKYDVPETLKIFLKEQTFGIRMSIDIDIKDFHEVFQPVKLNQMS